MAITPSAIIKKICTDYNTIAKEWDVSRYQPSPLKIKLLKKIKKGLVVGDIGCGNGLIVPEVLRLGAKKYFGMDISAKLIAIAKKKYKTEIKNKSVDFSVGSALNLDFSDKKFDVVFSFAVMHHLPGGENHLQFLKEIHRVLKDGGEAVVINWYLLNPELVKRFDIKNRLKTAFDLGYNERDVLVPWKATGDQAVERFVHIFTKEELKQLAKQAGFKKININHYSLKGEKKEDGEELVMVLKK